MPRLIAHRLLTSIPLVLVVTFLTFFLNSLAPGDLARSSMQGGGTEEQYQQLRVQLGLDQSVWAQYWHWLSRAATGDLGVSFFTGERVLTLLNGRVGVTLTLMIGVLIVCVAAGVSLGVASALRGGFIGRAIDVLSMLGLIFPSFWVALVFIAIFAVGLNWFPATGYTPMRDSPWLWFLGMVLPVMSVALHSITNVAKQTRDSMIDVMGRDFIRALRNAALPVVTVLGTIMIAAIGGAVFVERVFVLPGLGSLAVQAADQSDIALLQGATLYFTLLTVVINLGVDVSYGWLNPKMRAS
jgi:peptide/nickel transport system permease protein